MTGRLPLLAGILLVQLALIIGIRFSGGGDDGAEPFLDIDPDAVTGLVITDSAGQSVTLGRAADGWRMDDLPANADKVSEVMDRLISSAAIWPVATTRDAQKRFEVSSDSFQRKVSFEGEDGVLAQVYLGTSPGYRRVHARREGSDAVYSIDFAVFEVPVSRNDWLDRYLLGSSGVSRVELADGKVLASGGVAAGADNGTDAGWTLDGEPTDPDAVRRFIERFERLSVLGLYQPDEGEQAEAALGEPRSVVVEDGMGSHRMTFRLDDDNNQYVLSSDRISGEFTVASYLAEQLLTDGADLLAGMEPGAEEGAGGADGGADAGAGASGNGAVEEGTSQGASEGVSQAESGVSS